MVDRVFFFFQAEDGIRDIGVTGVQTCALPISENLATLVAAGGVGVRLVPGDAVLRGEVLRGLDHPGDLAEPPFRRSEERRVGKERTILCPPERQTDVTGNVKAALSVIRWCREV